MRLISHNEMRCGRYYLYLLNSYCEGMSTELGILKVHRIVREPPEPYYRCCCSGSFYVTYNQVAFSRFYHNDISIGSSLFDSSRVYELTDDEIMNHILIDSI